MRDEGLTGGFADPAIEAAHGFRAALTAMAKPGTIAEITGGTAPEPVSAAAASLLLTLCDPETPLYLAPGHDSAAIQDWVAFHTGAPIVAARDARFALGRWPALLPLSDYAIGTAEYPDRSATLIVELPSLEAAGTRLTGPGIEASAALNLPEQAAFQANAALYPQGCDFFFTAGSTLAALPRTTRLEA